MKSTLLKNYFYNSILLVINMIYPLITSIYINRIFELNQIGDLTFYMSIVNVFITLSTLGMVNYASKEIAIIKTNHNLLKKKFSEFFILNLLSSLFFFMIFIILFFSFYEKKKLIYIVLSLNIFGNIFNIEWFFIGTENFKYIFKRNIIVKILVLFLMFIFIKNKVDFNKYIILLVIGTIGNNIFNIKLQGGLL